MRIFREDPSAYLLKMGVLGEIPLHDAQHVVLAHLDFVRGKGAEQAPHPVNEGRAASIR